MAEAGSRQKRLERRGYGELDFRKKRKNTNIRGTARKQGKNSRQRELRFENEKREKRSSGKRWGKIKKYKRDRFMGSGTFARMYDGGFSRSSFRTESECYRRFDVACFKKRKCCDDKSLYL